MLNQLPGVVIDRRSKFPHRRHRGALRRPAGARRGSFLNDVMWSGKVMDLITSRKAFLNTQPRDDDLQRPGAGGRDADELRRDDASRRSARRHAHQRRLHHARARATGVGVVPARPRRQGAVPLPRNAAAARDAQRGQADAVDGADGEAGHADGAGAGRVPRGDAALQQLPPDVRSLRPGARLVRRRRQVPDRSTIWASRSTGHTTLPAEVGGATGAQRHRARGRAVEEHRVHELHGEDGAPVRADSTRRSSSRCPPSSQTGCAAAGVAHDGAAQQHPVVHATWCARSRPRPRSSSASRSSSPTHTTRPKSIGGKRK